MYLNGDFQESFNDFITSLKKSQNFYPLANPNKEDEVVERIADSDKLVDSDLYDSYSTNLRKAVDEVFHGADSEIAIQMRGNVTRFAAYKAAMATNDIKNEIQSTGSLTDAKQVLRAYNTYQATEYATTVARARTGEQWDKFMQPDNIRIFPNIKWLPSRSANPREAHRLFWNRIWPKKDPFWNTNFPGNIWNCKCDWEETMEDATDKTSESETPDNTSQAGLDTNPGDKGEIFSDQNSYVANIKSIPETIRTPVLKEMGELYYKDNGSNVQISAMADRYELYDNIITGRKIALSGQEVKIMPDFRKLIYGKKNPEFKINGIVSDAKRIKSASGISSGFSKAIDQTSKSVVIDYGDGEWRPNESKYEKIYFNAEDTAKGISNRYQDFENGIIEECWVVYKNAVVLIKKDVFLKYPGKTKEAKSRRVALIKKMIMDAIK